MPTVTKKDLVERLTERTGIKRTDVKTIVHEALELIIDELAQGNRLEFRDFGVFDVRERAARTAQNPKTLERVEVPPKRSVRFKAGRVMKLRVEGPASTTPGKRESTPLRAAVTPEPKPDIRVSATLNHRAASPPR